MGAWESAGRSGRIGRTRHGVDDWVELRAADGLHQSPAGVRRWMELRAVQDSGADATAGPRSGSLDPARSAPEADVAVAGGIRARVGDDVDLRIVVVLE